MGGKLLSLIYLVCKFIDDVFSIIIMKKFFIDLIVYIDTLSYIYHIEFCVKKTQYSFSIWLVNLLIMYYQLLQ